MLRIGVAVVVALSLFHAPLAATAQQPGKVYRLGFLRATLGGTSRAEIS